MLQSHWKIHCALCARQYWSKVIVMTKQPILVKSLLLAVFLVLGGCAVLPDNSSKVSSTAFTDTESTLLGANYAKASERVPGQNAFLLLPNGLDAFVARALLAQHAERSIDTQYYMVHGDHVGSLFVDQLLQAADRGVRVRLLLDDIDEGDRDFGIAVFDSHPNIEVRIFNPFGRNVGRIWQYATGFGKQTRRAHNKSFTVDNQATILGGRNMGDEYFSRDPDLEFQDIDVLAFGPVVQEVSASFDEYWNNELSYPISMLVEHRPTADEFAVHRQKFAEKVRGMSDSAYLDRLRNSDLASDFRNKSIHYEWGDGRVYADPPEKLQHDTGDRAYQMIVDIAPYMEAAEKELIIFSPYFVPGKRGVAFLKGIREKGTRVRILTNSLASNDVGIVHAGYSRYREDLLRAGVELHELNKITSKQQRKAVKKGRIGSSKSSLHAKSFVMDRENLFVGSLNLDPRSIVQNTEIGVVFDSPVLATRLARAFDEHIEDAAFRLELETDENGREQLLWHGRINGEQTTLRHEPNTSFWKRLGTKLMKWMPIESQI
jgi:putative cardiolipin synthase